MKDRKMVKGVKEVKRIEDNKIDEVIGEILKIESTALGIQRDTESEKEEYAVMLENKKMEFDKKLATDTSEKLENLKSELKANKEKELLAMRNNISCNISKLEKLYEENKEKWVDEIVNRIIKE